MSVHNYYSTRIAKIGKHRLNLYYTIAYTIAENFSAA